MAERYGHAATAAVEPLVRQVIGAAIEVHRELGPGFLESTYEEALSVEFALRQIAFQRQYPVKLFYKEQQVGEGRLDFLVCSLLIVELKAVETILPVHLKQVVSYLKATGGHLGLLLNFNAETMHAGIRRVIWD